MAITRIDKGNNRWYSSLKRSQGTVNRLLKYLGQRNHVIRLTIVEAAEKTLTRAPYRAAAANPYTCHEQIVCMKNHTKAQLSPFEAGQILLELKLGPAVASSIPDSLEGKSDRKSDVLQQSTQPPASGVASKKSSYHNLIHSPSSILP